MKWFKHNSGMRHDPKVKRLIRKYKADGWTVYSIIVESIAESLDPISQVVPVLQETSEDIALEFGIDSRRVEEIVTYAVNQGLLEMDENGTVFCFKLYNYADEYFTKRQKNKESYSDRNRQIIAAYKEYGVRDAIISILQHNPQSIRTLYYIGSYYRVTPELLQSSSEKAGYLPHNFRDNGGFQNSGVTPDLLPQEESTERRREEIRLEENSVAPEKSKPFSGVSIAKRSSAIAPQELILEDLHRIIVDRPTDDEDYEKRLTQALIGFFIQYQPGGRFIGAATGKETRSAKTIVQRAFEQFPEEPGEYISALVSCFWELRKTGGKGLREKAFIPSSLVQDWVWQTVSAQAIEKQQSNIDSYDALQEYEQFRAGIDE